MQDQAADSGQPTNSSGVQKAPHQHTINSNSILQNGGQSGSGESGDVITLAMFEKLQRDVASSEGRLYAMLTAHEKLRGDFQKAESAMRELVDRFDKKAAEQVVSKNDKDLYAKIGKLQSALDALTKKVSDNETIPREGKNDKTFFEKIGTLSGKIDKVSKKADRVQNSVDILKRKDIEKERSGEEVWARDQITNLCNHIQAMEERFQQGLNDVEKICELQIQNMYSEQKVQTEQQLERMKSDLEDNLPGAKEKLDRMKFNLLDNLPAAKRLSGILDNLPAAATARKFSSRRSTSGISQTQHAYNQQNPNTLVQ